MPPARSRSRMGRLDHVHIRVPDRAEAARWYEEHLGFEAVDAYDFWATGFEDGPLQISADGGRTMLALFEADAVEVTRYWPRALLTDYLEASS